MDPEERQSLFGNEPQRFQFKGIKNPNNPRDVLKKVSKVYIVKKANFINCLTCNFCIGENVYKVYKYREEHEAYNTVASEHEGGENEEKTMSA